MVIQFNQDHEWLYSATYSSHKPVLHTGLWDAFHEISTITSLSWLIAGDLNYIAHNSENVGGAPFNFHRVTIFNQRVNSSNLMNMGFQGSPYTWASRRRGGALVRECLDKGLLIKSGVLCILMRRYIIYHGGFQTIVLFLLTCMGVTAVSLINRSILRLVGPCIQR